MAGFLTMAEPGLTLPPRPVLAAAADGLCPPLAGKPVGPREVMNIVGGPNGTGDATVLYAVVAGPEYREGWIPVASIRPLAQDEAENVPAEARLPIKEAIRHAAIVQAINGWQEFDEEHSASCLTLDDGQLVQIDAARQDGWAHGSCMRNPSRRGWFPLSLTQRIEPSLQALATASAEEFNKERMRDLSPAAATALVDMLKAAREHPPAQREWAWEGELPAAVADSAQRVEQQWKECWARMDTEAQEAEAAAKAAAELEANQASLDKDIDAEDHETSDELIPDDCYPVVVCKTNFWPPNGSRHAMLRLQVGELARVTSLLDATMYHGFLETNPSVRGWFPRKSVQLVEDPLDDQDTGPPPADIRAPDLPTLPPNLMQRRRGA